MNSINDWYEQIIDYCK